MKWRIKGPRSDMLFLDSAKMILAKRIKILVKTIRKYFNEDNADNLHEMRIAIRRLRYTLEVFYCCFEKNIFIKFYEKNEYLQDLSGEVRDLDVLQETALSFVSDKVRVPKLLITSFAERRKELNEQLRLELMKFIHSSEMKEFKNQLK